MQKSKEGNSLVQILNNYAISQQFLDVTHYKHTQEHGRKSTYFYQALCTILESKYRLISEIPNKCSSLFSKKNRIDRWEIGKFKIFLQKMFQIFDMLSEFQIQGLTKLRNSRESLDSSEITFNDFVTNIEKYGEEQQSLFSLKKKYKAFIDSLELKSIQTKQKMKKPQNFYNIKLAISQLLTIQANIKQKSQFQENIFDRFQMVAKNSRAFEEQLMFFRQQLIIKKYQNIQKFTRLCKNSKQALVQMFSYLYQYIKNQKQSFTRKKSLQQISILSSKTEGFKLTELIIKEATSYRKIIEEYIQIVKHLIDCFAAISGESKELKLKQVELLQNINKYYEYNQCDIKQIKLTLDLYRSFLKQLSQLGDKLVYSYNNLIQLQKTVSKCTEMTLTLIKCSQHKKSPTHSRTDSNFSVKGRKQEQYSNCLDMLNDQLSETYIISIINKIYQDFRQTSLKIKEEFQVLQPNKRKKVENSMSMSYISEISVPIEKRPMKKDIWLWKDWKLELINNYLQVNQLQKNYKELQFISRKYKEQNKELQKLNCSFKKRKLNGFLKLNDKSMAFEAFDNSLILYIPMAYVGSVDMQLKMMTKVFKIQTQLGNLEFIDETEGDIKKFYVNTQKALESFSDRINCQVDVEDKISLSQQELQFILKRKNEIEKDLENVSQYEHFDSLILPDTHLVDLFRTLYSGNPIIIGGKQYQNFQASLMGKYRNHNEKYYPFDKPPPSYYSGVEGTEFFNCPLYSQKVIEYDHSLPKMPMLPQFCHNTQTIRFYWVSNQEFHMRQTNVTSNAPFTQNFYLVELITFKQEQNNIDIQFYMKLVELKDFTFKKMVYDKAKEEAKWGVKILIDQIKKAMAKYRKKGKNSKVGDQNANEQKNSRFQSSEIREFKSTIKRLQKRNKILLYVLVAAFLLNIFLKLF